MASNPNDLQSLARFVLKDVWDTSNNALKVNVVAGSTGLTEYTEDVATPAAIAGGALMLERDDALTTVTPIEGDWIGARGTAEGALWVQDFNSDAILSDTTAILSDTTAILADTASMDTNLATLAGAVSGSEVQVDIVSGASSGTEYTEDVASPAAIVGQAVLMERDDALTTVTPIEGDWIGLRGTAEGALWVQDFNSDAILADTTAILADTANMDTNLATVAGAVSGTEMQVDVLTMPSTAVTNAGTFAVQSTLQAGTAEIGKLAAGVAEIGNVKNSGTFAVQVDAALPAGTNAIGKLAANSGVDIGDVDVTSLPGIAGDVAVDTADSGNPVKVGGRAVNQDATAPGTAVAEADRTDFITDVYGRQFVSTHHPNLWDAADNQATAQTNKAIKAAPGAGLSLYITDIIVSNGATAGNIKFVEDTAGTPVDKVEVMYLAANGGAPLHFNTPIKVTANKDFGYTSVTVTTHSVTVCGYIAP